MRNIISRIRLAWMCLFSRYFITIKFHIKEDKFDLGGTVVDLKTTSMLLDGVSEKIKVQILSDKVMKRYKEVKKLN